MEREVRALAVFDDGGGPKLYAAGLFRFAGAALVNHVARFDGEWEPLGEAVAGVDGDVYAAAALDDGSGAALYVGGDFLHAGGSPASRIARWDGSHWSALGPGVNGLVRAVTVFDDGTGPALYVAGFFTEAGGAPASGLARWNGQAWSAVGGGLGPQGHGYTLSVFDEGSGPALYVGGEFDLAGALPINNIARWDGAAWSSLGPGLSDIVVTMLPDTEAHPPALLVGGRFTRSGEIQIRCVARWQAGQWSGVGSQLRTTDGSLPFVSTLAWFGEGQARQLFAGGYFIYTSDGRSFRYIARLNDQQWVPVVGGASNIVRALLPVQLGSQTMLVAAGDFRTMGDRPAARLAS